MDWNRLYMLILGVRGVQRSVSYDFSDDSVE